MRLPAIRSLPRPRVLTVLAVVALLIAGVVIVSVVRSGSTAPVRIEDAMRTVPAAPGSADTVNLDTRLYLPETSAPAPAVLLAHGFGGDKTSVDGQARDLASRGMVVLAYTARGFGASTGTISLNDPDREVADARALIDYLATRPEVLLDAPGDPRVAVAGASYGGALALMAAGTDRRIDADAAAITWNDLGQSLFPNYGAPADSPLAQLAPSPGASVSGGTGVLKRGWAGVFFGAGSGAFRPGTGLSGSAPEPGSSSTPNQAEPAGPCGRFDITFCRAYLSAAVSGIPGPDVSALLSRNSPTRFNASITAPTLIQQGQQDSLFGLDQADANARQIAAAGTPVELQWFDGGHDAGGTSASSEAAMSQFLIDHLKDTKKAVDPEFRFTLSGDPTDQGRRTRTQVAAEYPGLSAGPSVGFTTQTLNSARPTQSVIRPPGASPSAISSLPGVGSALTALGATGVGSLLTGDLPGQSAEFTTEPLTSDLTIAGSARVAIKVAAITAPQQAVLFAKLYDVGPDGRKTLPSGLVSPIRLPDNLSAGTAITVSLPGIGYRIPAGHRLQVAFATTDQAFATPLEPAQFTISLADTALTIPTVPSRSVGSSTAPVLPLIGIGALALLVGLVVAATTIRGRRRTAADLDPDLKDVPLAITDLAKTYSNGFTAVSDVSFTVERGQVLGLLGPNGAGKTTTLRMLMGLISPTRGEIRVFGHRVSPGSPVLSRLGSFIEGSGFLPHLSGMDNLQLYWKATGRPAEDAHLEEALEIADLGDAIHRKVRSYSQGMRQRLAIAQAMLGLPDLMVLDEPTNGLDPPQIRTMRDVLIKYAATGRTVLVSSHLLAEVEQTCTHVVVMNKGAVISAGTVADLIGGNGPTEFRAEPVERAREVVAAIDGVGDVARGSTDPSVIRANLGTIDTGDVVRALVAADISVRSVSRATRLEDVFLDLVHDDQPSTKGSAT